MKKILRPASISNLLARSFIVFLLVYLWVGYYVRGFIWVFLIATAVTFFVNYMFYFFSRKRQGKTSISRKKLEHLRAVILQLKFMTRPQALAFFRTCLQKKFAPDDDTATDKNTDKEKNKDKNKEKVIPFGARAVKMTIKKLSFQTEKKTVNFFTLFHKNPTQSDVVDCINSTCKECATYIAAESFSPDIEAFVKTLAADVKLLDAAAVYELLESTDTFPAIIIELKPKEQLTLAKLRALVFQRVKVRSYITIGIVILLTSFIIRFSIYYIVIATLVFGLGLISLFVPRNAKNLF